MLARRCLLTALFLCLFESQTSAQSLPERLSDADFWKMVVDFSEPAGTFNDNIMSNESAFQTVIPGLLQTIPPGGVYLGVGPEQNFTYIAALRPRIAFIIDIQRQNTLQLLMYKTLFEMAPTRIEFLSLLFGRRRPAGVGDRSSVDDQFAAISSARVDQEGTNRMPALMRDSLLKKHSFGLSEADLEGIAGVYQRFTQTGPNIRFGPPLDRPGGYLPYGQLMGVTDRFGQDRLGQQRSFLANEENYRIVREMFEKNLIVPLTGDLGGPKTLRAVGDYLKSHNGVVSAFYISNVEYYLLLADQLGGRSAANSRNGGGRNFYANLAALPLDSSSTFIRACTAIPRGSSDFESRRTSIMNDLALFNAGRITGTRSQCEPDWQP